jgi:septum formation protein
MPASPQTPASPHPRAAAAAGTTPRLYLASQSPRRLALLRQLGVEPALLLPGPEEDAEALEAERAGETPADYVQRVTRAKLRAAVARLKRLGLPPAPVLCADTTVAVGRRILAKPADASHASAMLRRLAGRVHRVHTAVAVHDGRRIHAALQTTRVWVAALSERDIAAYVGSGEPFGKAGAYGIQGAFAAHVPRLDGSHSGVMGLPLAETHALLVAAGVHAAPR